MELIRELDNFFRASATISELVSDELLAQISIKSPLQERVEAYLLSGGSLILSGTAGSGKTHLIRSLASSVDLAEYRVCEDLASTPQNSWEELGRFNGPSIVAANEGALLDASRRTSSATVYSSAVRLLHEMQVGTLHEARSGFLLVDMAAADAAANHVLELILGLPILHRYAGELLTPEQARAWALLQDENIRRRVAHLVAAAAASTDSGGFTFRQIWQFVGELIVKDNSNTPWTHRVFNGRSKISCAIQDTFPLSTFSLPKVGARLWYRDLNALDDRMSDDALDVLWDYDHGSDWHSHMIRVSIAVFALHDSPISIVLSAPRDLWSSLALHQDPTELIRAINRYLTYGLRTVGGNLELWAPTDLERRMSKPEAQVSLGTVPVEAFAIKRNLIFSDSGAEHGSSPYRGTRLSLYHGPSAASLALSRDLIAALSGIRSHRVSDRTAVEYDWRLFRFINRVATCGATATALHAVRLNFDQRSSRSVRFQLSERRIVGDTP